MTLLVSVRNEATRSSTVTAGGSSLIFCPENLVVFLVPDKLGGVVFKMGVLVGFKGFVSTWHITGGVVIPRRYITEFQIIESDINDDVADISSL